MTKIEVSTHSGDVNTIEIDDYDARKITEMRNDSTIEAITLGNHSYSRIDIKNIRALD